MTVRRAIALRGMVIGAVTLLGLAGCDEKPTETPFPALKPTVTISGIQISGGVTRVFANGYDDDGTVAYYRYKFDNGAVIDSVMNPTYGTTIIYGSMDESHTVTVWAVDNDRTASDPAQLIYTPNTVGAANKTPETEILSPPAGAVTSEGVALSWSARDPDGSLIAYEVRVDQGAWVKVTETSYNALGLAAGSHTAQVRAIDNFNVTDPTPASVTFTVKTGLKPELGTSGVDDGATFFVPAGGTVDLTIGWAAASDWYFGDVAAFQYEFQGVTSDWSAEESHTFTALPASATPYALKVRAKDIAGNIAETTISFDIVVPTMGKDVLVVNGVSWGDYGANNWNAVFPAITAAGGGEKWDLWDMFGTPSGGYPAGSAVNKIGNGTNVPGSVLKDYKAVLWLGNNYPGETWNNALIAGYIRAGGKVLLSTRRPITYFDATLRGMAHVTGFAADLTYAFTSLKASGAGATLGLQDVTLAGNSGGGNITALDASGKSEVLFVDGANPSVILGVRSKATDSGNWNFIVICGRQYRAVTLNGAQNAVYLASNYRKLLKDVFDVNPPAAP